MRAAVNERALADRRRNLLGGGREGRRANMQRGSSRACLRLRVAPREMAARLTTGLHPRGIRRAAYGPPSFTEDANIKTATR